jgi:NAD(P)-dependent dehydrogenase (short-subunit alcohol dehydrogenase family)
VNPPGNGDLAGRVAVVTGASGGIGATTAVALAHRGAALVLSGRDRARLRFTAAAVEQHGGAVAVVEGDVADPATAAGVAAATTERFGRVDVLFANAGTTGPLKPLVDYSDREFDDVVATNLRGVFLMMRATLPIMIQNRGGSVVVTASLGSERGLPGSAAYNAAKHGAVGLVRTAAVEYGRHNVRSNAVLVGLADTPLLQSLVAPDGSDPDAAIAATAATVPLGRVAEATDVADLVCFLASDAARYLNGAVLPVDGGLLTSAGGMF